MNLANMLFGHSPTWLEPVTAQADELPRYDPAVGRVIGQPKSEASLPQALLRNPRRPDEWPRIRRVWMRGASLVSKRLLLGGQLCTA